MLTSRSDHALRDNERVVEMHNNVLHSNVCFMTFSCASDFMRSFSSVVVDVRVRIVK